MASAVLIVPGPCVGDYHHLSKSDAAIGLRIFTAYRNHIAHPRVAHQSYAPHRVPSRLHALSAVATFVFPAKRWRSSLVLLAHPLRKVPWLPWTTERSMMLR